MEKYIPYVYHYDTLYIDRFLILDRVKIKDDAFDLFDIRPDSSTGVKLLDAQKNDYRGFEVFNITNNYFLSDLSGFARDEKVFLYTEIIAERKEDKVVLDFDLPGYSKVWLNSDILVICHERQNREHLDVCLRQGKNVLLIEYYLKQKSDFLPYAFIQVYNYDQIYNQGLLPRMKERMLSEKLKVISQYNPDTNEIKFMFIVLNSTESVVEVTHNLSGGDRLNEEKFEVLKEYSYKVRDMEGTICKYYMTSNLFPYVHNLLIRISESEANEIINQALSLIPESGEANSVNIMGMINKFRNDLTYDEDKYALITRLKRFISQGVLDNRDAAVSKVYYLSPLDYSYQEIVIKLPENYCDGAAYPLIACLGISEFDYYLFCEEKNNEYIIANISGRGVLGGSYISEVCYLEAIEYMKNHYAVDINRIYLLGKSNGGYASWSMMQNYPDLAAAAFPVSGYPYYNQIKNVTNTPIINYVSTLDSCYYNIQDSVNEILEPYNNYIQINVNNMVHHAISEFFHFSIQKFFSGKERNNYPDHIYFRTERNRYLKSFWLELHGISFGEVYALIEARVISEKRIDITIENTDGFTLTIPPQVNKKDFEVVVNKKGVHFSDYDKEKINFVFRDGCFDVHHGESKRDIDRIKGMGLLDVYMDNMRIIVPDMAVDVIMKAAVNFSTPSSNGYYNKISVNYPIYRLAEIKKSDLHNNLVFIGVEDLQQCFDMKIETPIKISREYFEYKGRQCYGDYCIMYIFKNPYDARFSVLSIQANDMKMLRKNMFTRKVVLPFSYLGIHEYWNNVALIFQNNEYYSIYEWGADLKKLA